MLAWACGVLRARHIIKVKACSAVEMVLPPGVFITTTPRLEAAATSMLSTPTPARPMTLRPLAASITFAVTLTPLRTMMALASLAAATKSASALSFRFTSTSKDGTDFKSSMPLSEIGSATRILYLLMKKGEKGPQCRHESRLLKHCVTLPEEESRPCFNTRPNPDPIASPARSARESCLRRGPVRWPS